ncbi:MAG TPA: hemerythrin domain-containing protein [Acidimicrobiales bacterium]|jgi:iron-sulfur cluster repair protein YtfE (RIC family)|nr:hemerythrin domain-containing protein [Acidimicrobiales bacterium]
MPDVTELLNTDHREVEQLFAEYEQTQDWNIAMQICDELLRHATVEEEIVYPALEKADQEITQEAEQEHQDAEQLIEQIQSLEADDPQLPQLMTQLKEAVQHHVEEEESEAWPKLREQFGDKLDELGTKVEERKQQLKAEEEGTGSGGSESGAGGLIDLTKDELMEKAREADIQGRSKMNKDELAQALENQ